VDCLNGNGSFHTTAAQLAPESVDWNNVIPVPVYRASTRYTVDVEPAADKNCPAVIAVGAPAGTAGCRVAYDQRW
jgi:hypothetical protein